MKFTEHIPTFIDIDNSVNEYEFSTLQELIENPFVKKYRTSSFDDTEPHPYFKNYSISKFAIENNEERYLLMAEYTKVEKIWPMEYWVVGFLYGGPIQSLGLPELGEPVNKIVIKEE